MNEVLSVVSDVVAWTIGIPLLWFIGTYLHSAWRQNPLGIEKMIGKVKLLALWLLVMVGNLLPTGFDTARHIATIILCGFVTFVLTLEVINLRRVQTDSKKPLFFTWFTYLATAKRNDEKHHQE